MFTIIACFLGGMQYTIARVQLAAMLLKKVHKTLSLANLCNVHSIKVYYFLLEIMNKMIIISKKFQINWIPTIMYVISNEFFVILKYFRSDIKNKLLGIFPTGCKINMSDLYNVNKISLTFILFQGYRLTNI